MLTVNTIGYIAGVVNALAGMPQLLQILRTRSAGDVSKGMFVMFVASVLLWTWYGIRLHAWPLIVSDVVVLVQYVVILALKRKFDCRQRRQFRFSEGETDSPFRGIKICRRRIRNAG